MDRTNNGLAQGFAAVIGIVLLGAGLVGLINLLPGLVSEQDNALFRANNIHDIIHVATGALALFIAFGLRGRDQANALIGFGVVYALVFVLLIVDPTLFGLFRDAPANIVDHILHAVLAIGSIAIGYLARSDAGERTVVTR